MKKFDPINAWKNEEYRSNLSAEERALLPENPAGLVELTDEALKDVSGGPTCLAWSCKDNEVPTEQL